jgi:RNA polymerase sigma factor (sigma-70 family)
MNSAASAGSRPSGTPAYPGASSTRAWSLTTTDWFVVQKAQDGDADALQRLCLKHQYPIYAFFRSKDKSRADALDLTQELFSRIVQRDSICAADAAKGKLRSWFLVAARNLLIDQSRRRRPEADAIPIDEAELESLFQESLSVGGTPDQVFDRAWAQSMWQRSIDRLRAEFEPKGKTGAFQVLCASLGPTDDFNYVQFAKALSCSEEAARVAVHRFRKRFGEVLRDEVSQMTDNQEAVGEELKYLASVLADKGSAIL